MEFFAKLKKPLKSREFDNLENIKMDNDIKVKIRRKPTTNDNIIFQKENDNNKFEETNIANKENQQRTDSRFLTSRKESFNLKNEILSSKVKEDEKILETKDTSIQILNKENHIFNKSDGFEHLLEVDEEFDDQFEKIERIFSKVRHNRKEDLLKALDEGFDPFSRDANGNTLLHVCAQNNNKKMASFLVKKYPMCDLNARNNKSFTPLDYSEKYGFQAMTEWLVSRGAVSGNILRKSQFR